MFRQVICSVRIQVLIRANTSTIPCPINHQKHAFCVIPAMTKQISNNARNQLIVRCYSTSLPSGLSEMKMPALSPTMDKGNIVRWRVRKGDWVGPRVVVCEIDTDKARLEYESPEEGYMAKILKPENSNNVLIGETIAIVADKREDIPKAADMTVESLASAAYLSAPASTTQSEGFTPEGISEIKMPTLSPTMTDGSISKWRVKPGDQVKVGDALCDVETDKAIIELRVEESGYLAQILKPEGVKGIHFGEAIALLAESKEAIARVAQYKPGIVTPPVVMEEYPKEEEEKSKSMGLLNILLYGFFILTFIQWIL